MTHLPKPTPPITKELIDAVLRSQKIERAISYLRYKRKIDYLNEVHTFHLYRGEDFFGRSKEMTGKEAASENRRFQRSFIDTKKKNARMFSWKLDKNDPAYRYGVALRKKWRERAQDRKRANDCMAYSKHKPKR